MKYILNYTTQSTICRNKILLSYFDEFRKIIGEMIFVENKKVNDISLKY